MFVVKTQQMKQLSTALEVRYVRETGRFLRLKYPEFAERHPADSVDIFVRSGIEKAKRYKILERTDTTAFLRYMAAFGSDFENNPEYQPLKRILLIRNLKGTEKISRMLQKIKP